MRIVLISLILCFTSITAQAGMRMGDWGMVMNENHDELPQGCESIAGEQNMTIKAGREYAKPYPGTIFGYSQHEFRLPKCSRITVTFVNEDDIRHQFMIHGLPTYLHPQGMFHMELYGRGEAKGTFITPNTDYTFLAHCDIAQHMEKGMKIQVIVGNGSGSLPSIPGITGQLNKDFYELDMGAPNLIAMFLLLLLGFSGALFFFIWKKK